MKKLFTLMTLLVAIVTGAWADTSISWTEFKQVPTIAGMVKITNEKPAGDNAADITISSSALQLAKEKIGAFAITSTVDGFYIKSITFTDTNKKSTSTITCDNSEDTFTHNTSTGVCSYTPKTGTTPTSVKFNLTTGNGGAIQVKTMTVTLASTSTDPVETIDNFAYSSSIWSYTSSAGADSQVTFATTSTSASNKSVSFGSGKTITITSAGKALKFIAFKAYQDKAQGMSPNTGTFDATTGIWTPETDVKTVTFSYSASSSYYIQNIFVGLKPATPVFTLSKTALEVNETAKILVDGQDIFAENFTAGSLWESAIGGGYVSLSADGTVTALQNTPDGYFFKFYGTSKDATKYNSAESGNLSISITTKYAVTYKAGEGTGEDIDGGKYAEGETVTLPANSFTAPEGKYFIGWKSSADDAIYTDEYTMTAEATDFTAQYAPIAGSGIIKVTMTSKNTGNVTGSIGGTATVSLHNDSFKFGTSGNYVSLTLANGTFQEGDVINIHTTNAADLDPGTIVIFGSSTEDIIYNTGERGGLGDNKYALPAAVNGKSTISVRRTETYNFNGFVDYIEVTRPSEIITIGAGGYSTYANESNYTVSGAKVYTAQNKTASVGMTEVAAGTIIPANAGIVLQGAEGDKVSIIYTTEDAASLGANDLIGVTAAQPFSPNALSTQYVIATKAGATKFYKFVDSTFPDNKAYLEVATDSGDAIDIDFGDATAISNVNVNGNANPNDNAKTKVIRNGKLYIGNYNIAGQRVK